MKTIILFGLGAIVIGFGAYATITGNVGEVMKPNVIEVSKDVEVDVLSKRIEAAVEAARPEIEAKADADYKTAVEAAEAAYQLALAQASTSRADRINRDITAVEDEQKALFIQEIEATISADAPY